MDSFDVSDMSKKRSMPEDSPTSSHISGTQFNHAGTPTGQRKKFKNNEILSSLSSMKKIPDTKSSHRPKLAMIDPQIPVPLKRKRDRESESDDDGETPNKKRKRTVQTTSIAIQTTPQSESIFNFDGDNRPSCVDSRDMLKPIFQRSSGKNLLLAPVLPSQTKSPLRSFTMEEHTRDDKKQEARVRRYLEAIRNAVSGPPPKFYEPPKTSYSISTSLSAPISSHSSILSLPVVTTSSETVPIVSKPSEGIKPITFNFGSTTSSSTTSVSTPSIPFSFAPPISSGTIAATTTTSTSLGSITTPLVQPSVAPTLPKFNFTTGEASKTVTFGSFVKNDQQFSDSPGGSPNPNRKIARANRRLPQATESTVSSTSGFAPISFAPPITTQAPSLTSTTSQATGFNFNNPSSSIFAAPNPQPSNPSVPFTFGQQAATVPPNFNFGAPSQPPAFGAPQGGGFNAQVPPTFEFGANPVLNNLNNAAGLFTPGTVGAVAKPSRRRGATRSKYR